MPDAALASRGEFNHRDRSACAGASVMTENRQGPTSYFWAGGVGVDAAGMADQVFFRKANP